MSVHALGHKIIRWKVERDPSSFRMGEKVRYFYLGEEE